VKYIVLLEDEALIHVKFIAAYLEGVRSGYGEKFLDAVDETVFILETHPLMYRKKSGIKRLIPLARFKYQMVFRVSRKQVTVIRIVHAHSRSRVKFKGLNADI
jgi:hypothetical protein